jgi:23S rRNA pseudouridine2605 synthase
MERIQKILAAGGIASRRAAEKLITEGRVRVNGRVVTELGAKADARNDRIEVDGKRVVAEQHVYIVLHKPRGVVATMSDPEGRPTVRDILAPVGARVYPVGRLDFATSGVLLATNDGDFAEGLLHPKKAVPKTYVVKVNGKMKSEDMDRWRNGVQLEDGMTHAAEAKTLRFEGDKTWFELTIKEGRNQQIRRMGEATGFPVMRLARLEFAQISAEGLRPGQWRHMTREELVQLKKTYGVPKSVPSPPEQAIAPARRARGPSERRPVKDDRPRRGPPARENRERRAPRDGAPPPAEKPRGPNTHRRSGRGGTGAGSGGPGAPKPETTGPRYGGGSPGRRGYEVTEDRGGGVRRGSSSGDTRGAADTRGGADARGAPRDGGRAQRETPQQPHQGRPHPNLGGGRGGRTRTTGTAGGVGTTHDADRVKGRRGR